MAATTPLDPMFGAAETFERKHISAWSRLAA